MQDESLNCGIQLPRFKGHRNILFRTTCYENSSRSSNTIKPGGNDRLTMKRFYNELFQLVRHTGIDYAWIWFDCRARVTSSLKGGEDSPSWWGFWPIRIGEMIRTWGNVMNLISDNTIDSIGVDSICLHSRKTSGGVTMRENNKLILYPDQAITVSTCSPTFDLSFKLCHSRRLLDSLSILDHGTMQKSGMCLYYFL